MSRERDNTYRSDRPSTGRPPADHRHRIAVLPSLSARPLIEGLDACGQLDVMRALPGEMQVLMAGDRVEVAMMGPVEMQRYARPLVILPAGCLSAAGDCMQIRIFSRVPPEEVHLLWAEAGSATASGLAEVLWAMNYRRRLRVIPFRTRMSALPEDADAVLVTADRVVVDPPFGYDFQIDLLAMWYRLTGLPFVMAAWTATELAHLGWLNERFKEACELGKASVEAIAERYAQAYGWPLDLALRELAGDLCYEFTDDHIEGLQEFFELAETIGVIDAAHPIHVAT